MSRDINDLGENIEQHIGTFGVERHLDIPEIYDIKESRKDVIKFHIYSPCPRPFI